MYGIISFNKGEQSASAEFRAQPRKYGRGSACKGCRIARVKCSGTLHGTDCDRCKRLEMDCQYPSIQTRGHRRDSPPPDSTRDSTPSTRPVTPKLTYLESPLSPVSTSPTLDITNRDEPHLMTDESFGFGLDLWLPIGGLQDHPSGVEPHQLVAGSSGIHQIESLLTPPHTESLSLDPVQPKKLPGTGEMCETYATHFPNSAQHELHDEHGMGRHETGPFKAIPDHPGVIPDLAGAICPCRCHQGTTSCLSMLRGWTLDRRPGAVREVDDHDTSLKCAKAEEFLPLFEKLIAQLEMIENCPQDCIMSQDLAILLLLAVEKLAELLLSLAADFTGNTPSSNKGISPRTDSQARTSRGNTGVGIQPTVDKRVARIGSYEIQDPGDLQMIMQLLLQIRTRALDAYVCRWSNRIKHFGLKSLEIALANIREELSKVTGG
ncbi:hypothetical protein F5Y12DRAFT_232257 [Xylaria sp. FL1777]|nr:hypothetical protein F5Y12DRAFT_232257 [Xylaria sp. FL1777]